MGERASIGHLVYNVFETQWLTQLHTADGDPRVPQNRFLLVRVSIVNGGASEIFAPNLTVEDDKGNSYSELNNGDGVPQWVGYIRKIWPADSAQGNLVFDVPLGSYKLRIEDEDSNRTALVDLPFSLGTDTPEVPLPAPPENK